MKASHQNPTLFFMSKKVLSDSSASDRIGFTITELLCVITIMGIMTAISVPLMLNTRSNHVNESCAVITGMLDQARQYAVAKNSCVWVLLSEPMGNPSRVSAVTVASKTGLGILGWSTAEIDLQSIRELEFVSSVRPLTGVLFADEPGITVPGALGSGQYSPFAPVKMKMNAGGIPCEFTRAIEFTPTGEAKVSDAFTRSIQITLRSSVETKEAKNQIVIQLAGLTGAMNVYRP
jgi:prepilin-type N-terminal cleavage/methylation domain-containing protein